MPLTTIRDILSHIPYDTGGPVDIPVTLSREIAAESFVVKVEITNVSGVPRTVSVYDGGNVPLIPPHVLADTEVITYTAASGRRMTGGVWWQASGPGCKGYITGYLA